MMKHFITSTILLAVTFYCVAQQSSIPRDTTFTVWSAWNKIKDAYPVAVPVKEQLPNGVVEYRNLIYATIENTSYGPRHLHLDLFRPQGNKKLPALIMVHGGGWSSGNKSMEVPLAQKIATNGYVTITVEYQLSPEAVYPAAVHNIKAAIRWVRANASKYHINADKIAISGTSAGGQLAALVGLSDGIKKFEGSLGNQQFSSSVQGILVIDGVINFLAPLSLNKKRTPNSADIRWIGGSYTEKPQTWKEASPIFYANPSSPPMLFINSGIPRFHAGQDELKGLFTQWNIYYEIHSFSAKIHPFWLFHPWFEPTAKHMTDFLNKIF
ncbi:alpha/beta hydrolase fold domain-containing protein [Thermophagus sp. OGC60D27]|uniref:alpha/beta hydrolase fold domain-containing protein n=1 Tax=Thermophagus sp. OGC60D27 TaxID=3458415 RepID=UPI0040382A9B